MKIAGYGGEKGVLGVFGDIPQPLFSPHILMKMLHFHSSFYDVTKWLSLTQFMACLANVLHFKSKSDSHLYLINN